MNQTQINQIMKTYFAVFALIMSWTMGVSAETPKLHKDVVPLEGSVVRDLKASKKDSFVIGLSNFALNNNHSTQTSHMLRHMDDMTIVFFEFFIHRFSLGCFVLVLLTHSSID